MTLGLLHGSAPDLLVLVHKADSDSMRNYPKLTIPPLPELIAPYEAIAAPVRPARVAALALNTSTLDEAEARAAVASAEEETGLTADDVVRFGAERVLDAVLERLPEGRLGGASYLQGLPPVLRVDFGRLGRVDEIEEYVEEALRVVDVGEVTGLLEDPRRLEGTSSCAARPCSTGMMRSRLPQTSMNGMFSAR